MFRSFMWISLKSSKSIILNSHWCSRYTFLAFLFSVAQNMVNRIFRLIKSPNKIPIFQLRKSLSSTRTILPKVLRRRIRSKSWGLGRWWMVILWRFWSLFNGMLVVFLGGCYDILWDVSGFFLNGILWCVMGCCGNLWGGLWIYLDFRILLVILLDFCMACLVILWVMRCFMWFYGWFLMRRLWILCDLRDVFMDFMVCR
jgi:hypothetical protein